MNVSPENGKFCYYVFRIIGNKYSGKSNYCKQIVVTLRIGLYFKKYDLIPGRILGFWPKLDEPKKGRVFFYQVLEIKTEGRQKEITVQQLPIHEKSIHRGYKVVTTINAYGNNPAPILRKVPKFNPQTKMRPMMRCYT